MLFQLRVSFFSFYLFCKYFYLILQGILDVFVLDICSVDGLYGLQESPCGEANIRGEGKLPSFCDNWKSCNSSNTHSMWKYQNQMTTGGWTISGNLADYPGGGYVADLGRSKEETDNILRYMLEQQWLDEYTRAVFVELNLFNTNANFFIYISLLAELTAAGGANTRKKVLTTRLDRYSSGLAIFVGACEVLFLAFTVYYMYREVSYL